MSLKRLRKVEISSFTYIDYEKRMLEKLEAKRKDDLQKASQKMKSRLVNIGRCPICTLVPP